MSRDSTAKGKPAKARAAGWRAWMLDVLGGPRTRDDLVGILQSAREHGLVDGDAFYMIQGVLATSELQVRDIMVNRGQMTVVEQAWPLEQLLAVAVESGHSRFPVIGDSKDEVVGVLLAKDLLRFTTRVSGVDPATFDIKHWLRPAAFVPESKRVNVLLKDFRGSRNHMAMVVDEYGGVSGLVTIEDVLEQIVGDIADEHDESEAAKILKQDERRFLVQGLTPVEEFNAYFKAEFSTDEFDTIGGLVIHRLGHMPRRGESVKIGRFGFNVQRADNRRVHLLQVSVIPET